MALPTIASAAELKIDLEPFFSVGREWLAVIAAVIGGIVAKFVASFVQRIAGVYVDDKVRAAIDMAVRNGINYGTNLVLEKLESGPKTVTVEVRNEIVRLAASYVIERVPEYLGRFKLDEAAVEKLILGRLHLPVEVGSRPAAPMG